MHFSVNHEILKIPTCTKEFQGFQNFGVVHSNNRLKDDMWFMVNMQLINQTIEFFINVKFEIKS